MRWMREALAMLAGLTLLLTAGCGRTSPPIGHPRMAQKISGPAGTLKVAGQTMLHIQPVQAASWFLLTTVDFLSPKIAWAATYQNGTSTLLQSLDGGKTWRSQGEEPGMVRQIDFVNAMDGWAVLNPSQRELDSGTGIVIGTVDGGNRWRVLYRVPGLYIDAMSFVNATTGWLSGSQVGGGTGNPMPTNVLFRSHDGGQTWTALPGPYPKFTGDGGYGNFVSFIDPQNGWLLTAGEPGAGTQGKGVWRTGDGGRHWHLLAGVGGPGPLALGASAPIPVGGYIIGLSFHDATHGLMLLERNYPYRTTDGGRTWQPAWPSVFPPDPVVTSMGFVDAQHGWALSVGYSGATLFATRDGGNQWRPVFPPLLPMSGGFYDSQEGIGLGSQTDSRAILGTHDGGASWQVIGRTPTDLGFGGVIASDKIWAYGGSGQIYLSGNGGRSWDQVPLPTGMGAASAFFTSFKQGWVVGMRNSHIEPMLLRTTDGGRHWTRLALPFAPSAVSFIDARHGWALADNPGYYPSSTLFSTSDGGVTWTRYDIPAAVPPAARQLYRLQWVNRQTGWLWSDSTIWRTRDGGRSWSVGTLPDQMNIGWVSFIDLRRGWLKTLGGQFLETSDGGDTWSPVTTSQG